MDDRELEHLASLLVAAHPWHGVPPGDPAGVLNVYVEIVPTDVVKYELDKASGHLRIDRPQRYSSQCPSLYGFVPRTYCGAKVAARCGERTGKKGLEGDGDPLDVCVLTEKTVAHGGFLAHALPVGGLRLVDRNQVDDKVIAVLEGDVVFGGVRRLRDCPRGLVDRLRHYFLSYKQMPGEPVRRVELVETYDRAEAVEVVRRSIADYGELFGEPGGRLPRFAALMAARKGRTPKSRARRR